jgi:Cdc6-like AAA superfamily ATPase
MNILEKYIEKNNQFIVLINGITGTSKTYVAKKIMKILNNSLKENKLKLIK